MPRQTSMDLLLRSMKIYPKSCPSFSHPTLSKVTVANFTESRYGHARTFHPIALSCFLACLFMCSLSTIAPRTVSYLRYSTRPHLLLLFHCFRPHHPPLTYPSSSPSVLRPPPFQLFFDLIFHNLPPFFSLCTSFVNKNLTATSQHFFS